MKKYESPVLEVKELAVSNEIAFTLDENNDNETGWMDGWTSGVQVEGN